MVLSTKLLRSTGLPIFLGILSILVFPIHVKAAVFQLAWDPSPDNDIDGYLLYVGQESGQYSEDSIFVGNNTTYNLSLDQPGTYYIAAKARDFSGNISLDFSNEIELVVQSEEISIDLTLGPLPQSETANRDISLEFFDINSGESLFAQGVTSESDGSLSFTPSQALPSIVDLGIVTEAYLRRIVTWNTSEPFPSVNLIPGDLNGDNIINGLDIGILLAELLLEGQISDFNGDGITNLIDAGIVLENFLVQGD